MKLYNEDCLVALKEIPDESVDCVVTDCPYHIVSGGCSTGAYGNGNGIFQKTHEPSGIFERHTNKVKVDSNGNEYQVIEHGNRLYTNTKHVSLGGCLNDYDSTTYARQGKLFKHNDIKFEEWLPEVYRVLKQNTHCYIMINPRNLAELQVKAEKVGFKFQQILIWQKNNATPNKYYLNSYEMILMLRKGKAKNINHMGTKNILQINNIIGNKKHPTEKPVELMEILIDNSTRGGDVVLDPFMGAGSTGVACKNLGRDFIGVEIDERYFKIAEERINEIILEEEKLDLSDLD